MPDGVVAASQIDRLLGEFESLGVRRLFVKALPAKQDNDKNQIYLSTGLEGLANVLRARIRPGPESTSTTKRRSEAGARILYSTLDWSWIGDGPPARAPDTQLRLYLQYPEARLSGFISGCPNPPDALRRERLEAYGPRTLLFGVSGERVFGAVVVAPVGGSHVSLPNLRPSGFSKVVDVLHLDPTGETSAASRVDPLLGRWHSCVRLRRVGELPVPFTANQAPGYTLEALLGIPSNAESGPDLLGAELKSFRWSRKVTLMTPVADGGAEKRMGLRRFLEVHGWPGQDGSSRRFTGVYKVGGPTTPGDGVPKQLSLRDRGEHVLDATAVDLVEVGRSEPLASWSREHLVDKWVAKHDAALYVSYERQGNEVRFDGYFLCEGTSPERFMAAVEADVVYFDPAHTLKGGQVKNRPQWRMSTSRKQLERTLSSLYREVRWVD